MIDAKMMFWTKAMAWSILLCQAQGRQFFDKLFPLQGTLLSGDVASFSVDVLAPTQMAHVQIKWDGAPRIYSFRVTPTEIVNDRYHKAIGGFWAGEFEWRMRIVYDGYFVHSDWQQYEMLGGGE